MTHLKVAVRVRPLSERELQANSTSIVSMENNNNITITNIKVPEQHAGDSRERTRRFAFDYCFDEKATQDEVFEAIGTAVRKSIRKRHHSCVLAYGQSSSGKTHTMMGFSDNLGLTPKLCQNIFEYFRESAAEHEVENMETYVSYLEIYNEKVRDLLGNNVADESRRGFKTLKVREHPKKGPYVQGLSEHKVSDSASLLEWLQIGNRNRKVASTSNNQYSSRSHSVFTVTSGGIKLHLIDLAGSERAGNRCWGSSRFREGANINKSLVALGNVIYVLAEKSCKSRRFVPYRDSLLTWLLKDTLGGNSRTIMIATVSPSNLCYSETVNTLRFGQRAKQVIIQPLVNEDPKEKTIRELRAEIFRLKELLQNQCLSGALKSALLTSPASDPPEVLMESPSNSVGSVDIVNKGTAHKLTANYTTREFPEIPSRVSQNLSHTKTEKLFPIMDVKSTIKTDKSSLRRTFSASTSESNLEKEKPKFGSHEAISTGAVAKIARKPHTPLRRPSVEKPSKTSAFKRIVDQKMPIKADRGTVTEVKGPKPPETSRRPSIKPRSEIVAAVTQRLYARVKKKETTTETEEKKPVDEAPKELTICSNARLKLQELTRKALRAHRQREVETQTDLFPVLRVKETSTDVDDLGHVLHEVRDVETDPMVTEMKSVGVSCSLLEETFAEQQNNQRNCLTLTRTCGTQSKETGTKEDEFKPSIPLAGPLSFTKYLQNRPEPKFEILNPCTANPIYTTSVNINVSHNYGVGSKPSNTVLVDSLEDHKAQNVCFPTPDLISNHNSLDAYTYTADEESSGASEQNTAKQVHYAAMEALKDEHHASSVTMEARNALEFCVASCCVTPSCSERLQSVDLHSVCAPECVVKASSEERCVPLAKSLPEAQNVAFREVESNLQYVTQEEPVVLKSILKHQNQLSSDEAESSDSSTSDAEGLENELPDSLNYHAANNKKVRFAKKQSSNDNHIFIAMSQFLEEATNLLSNLSSVANKMESNSEQKLADDYDLHVTINDVTLPRTHSRRLKQTSKRKRLSTEDFAVQTSQNSLENAYSQTLARETSDAASLTDNFELPVNKFERLVEDSCDRLERCVNKSEEQFLHVRNECLHKFPQPFTANDGWNFSSTHYGDDSSIESNPTLSDYGSLPRTKGGLRTRTSSCSPSAFLRQLAFMREDVVRSSREELYKHANEQL